jgi:carboxymethylenebutenolidase
MDQTIINLFDSYTHGGMNRRAFLDRLAVLAGSTAAASALLHVLENNYAQAAMVAEDDPRLVLSDAEIAPGIKGLLAMPKDAAAKIPAVLVILRTVGLIRTSWT